MLKVSVIVPTYKPKDYIWTCLDSLLAQTMDKQDFEVILVLNGDREPYETDIRYYILLHPELKIIFHYSENAGVSNARNIALDIASGEYITFIDDDDYVSSSYLEELYFASRPDTIGLSYLFEFVDGQPRKQVWSGVNNIYRKYYQKQPVSFTLARKYFAGPCMKMIHRNCIMNRRFNTKFQNGEDSIYMFLISDKFKYVSFTSDKAIYYRRYREGSAIMRNRSNKERLYNTIRGIKEYFRIYNIKDYNLYFFVTRILAEIKYIVKILS